MEDQENKKQVIRLMRRNILMPADLIFGTSVVLQVLRNMVAHQYQLGRNTLPFRQMDPKFPFAVGARDKSSGQPTPPPQNQSQRPQLPTNPAFNRRQV